MESIYLLKKGKKKKKLVVILMVLMMGIGSVSAKEHGYIIFGRASQECTNVGLCKMRLEVFGVVFGYNIERGAERPSEAVAVETSVDESKNTYTLTFSIREAKQKAPSKASNLDQGKFYVDEDITLSSDLNKAYGLKRTTPIILKAGTYDVRKNGDIATVVINIR
jgi:hypothetical protein